MIQYTRNFMNVPRTLMCLVAVAMIGAGSAQAATVYGTNYDPNGDLYSGSRSAADGELVTVPLSSSDWPNAVVSWDISESGGVYTYEYKFEDFAGPGGANKQISHWTLDLTDNAVSDKGDLVDPKAVYNVMVKANDGDYIDYTGELSFGTGGDNEIEGIVGAVKLDPGHSIFGEDFEGTLYFKFDSNRAPVWGDVKFKAKDDLTNLHFGNHVDGDTVDGYIARPNGSPPPTNVIPTPAALPAGLAMLLALSLPKRGVLTLRRRR